MTSQASGSSSARMLLDLPAERTRRGVARKALLFVPLALVFLGVTGLALYNAFTNSGGALVGAIVFGIPAVALSYEASSALRDLRGAPVTSRGVITRMWNKGTVLWMTRAYYLLVTVPGKEGGGQFFVVPHEVYLQLDEGRTVEVRHWPHTNAVISLAEVESRSQRTQRATRSST